MLTTTLSTCTPAEASALLITELESGRYPKLKAALLEVLPKRGREFLLELLACLSSLPPPPQPGAPSVDAAGKRRGAAKMGPAATARTLETSRKRVAAVVATLLESVSEVKEHLAPPHDAHNAHDRDRYRADEDQRARALLHAPMFPPHAWPQVRALFAHTRAPTEELEEDARYAALLFEAGRAKDCARLLVSAQCIVQFGEERTRALLLALANEELHSLMKQVALAAPEEMRERCTRLVVRAVGLGTERAAARADGEIVVPGVTGVTAAAAAAAATAGVAEATASTAEQLLDTLEDLEIDTEGDTAAASASASPDSASAYESTDGSAAALSESSEQQQRSRDRVTARGGGGARRRTQPGVSNPNPTLALKLAEELGFDDDAFPDVVFEFKLKSVRWLLNSRARNADEVDMLSEFGDDIVGSDANLAAYVLAHLPPGGFDDVLAVRLADRFSLPVSAERRASAEREAAAAAAAEEERAAAEEMRRKDFYDPTIPGGVMIVGGDDLESLEAARRDLVRSAPPPAPHGTSDSERLDAMELIGVDSEFIPSFTTSNTSLPCVLQLSSRRAVFLFDLMRFTPAMDTLLADVFGNPHAVKIAFDIGSDLRVLRTAFPHARCFANLRTIVDLQTVQMRLQSAANDSPRAWSNVTLPIPGSAAAAATAAAATAAAATATAAAAAAAASTDASSSSNVHTPDASHAVPARDERAELRALLPPARGRFEGLASLVSHVLGAPLDKKCRMTNWSRRPLRRAQIRYAALDAFCLVALAPRLDYTLALLHRVRKSPSKERSLLSFAYDSIVKLV